eukprot:278884_1
MMATFLSFLFTVALSSSGCDESTLCATGYQCTRRDSSITAPSISDPANTETVTNNQQQCEEDALCDILGIDGICKSIDVQIKLPYIVNKDECTDSSTALTFNIPIEMHSNLVCGGTVDDCTVDINLSNALKSLTACYVPDYIMREVQCENSNTTQCPDHIKQYFITQFPTCACNVLYPVLNAETGYSYIPIVADWMREYVTNPVEQIRNYYADCVSEPLVCDGQVMD